MFDIEPIIKHIRKVITAKDLVIIGGIIFLFFATRLILLDKFPIFNDEGIYIHWAKVAWHDASWRFISLTDGKQPLQTWGTIPFLKLFPSNALLAGRLFAVSSGFVALCGMFALLYYLFGKKAAYIGSLLYIFTPYFLFYDRMALVDSGVNAGFIWILFLSIVLVNKRTLGEALSLGLTAGTALLAKSSVRIFLGLAVFAPILIIEKNWKQFSRKALNYIILLGIATGLAIVIYNVQRLSPFFHFVAEKNKTFIMTFAEFKATPFANFFNNIILIPEYIFWESGFIVPVLGLFGLVTLLKKNLRLAVYFLLWIVCPYIIVAFVSKVLFPRYIIFFASLFVILATYAFISIKNKIVIVCFIVAFVLSAGIFDYTIVKDYANIPFPPVDRGQYIESWPAGYGIKEIVDFAREKSKEKPVILLSDGDFGMAGDLLDTYLRPADRIWIHGYWPLEEKQLLENQKELDNNYVYVVMAHKLSYPKEWPLKLIYRFDKPGGKSVIYLFELTR